MFLTIQVKSSQVKSKSYSRPKPVYGNSFKDRKGPGNQRYDLSGGVGMTLETLMPKC